MERFSCKGAHWCGVPERTRIEVLKEELTWAIDKQLQMLFETAVTLRK